MENLVVCRNTVDNVDYKTKNADIQQCSKCNFQDNVHCVLQCFANALTLSDKGLNT